MLGCYGEVLDGIGFAWLPESCALLASIGWRLGGILMERALRLLRSAEAYSESYDEEWEEMVSHQERLDSGVDGEENLID